MTTRAVIGLYRLCFASLTIAAMATQMVNLAGEGKLDAVNYLTYFTIDSNTIATVLLLVGAASWRSERSPVFDLLRGAAVVYMSVTGAVFAVLLSGTNVDTAIPWVNSVVHEVMPMVVIADWLIDPPAQRIGFRRAVLWLSFPLVWIVYEQVRGAITGAYHYPFMSPAHGGYGAVVLYSLAILALMLVVCAAVAWLGNLRAPARTVPS